MNKPELFKRFCEDLWTHVQHAKNKHPNRYVLPEQCKADDVDGWAKWYKSLIDESKPEFEHVLRSEYCEFMAEAERHNDDRAREESLDVCAVLYRYVEQRSSTWTARDCTTLRVGIDLSVSAFMEFDHRATELGITIQEYIKELIGRGVKAEMKEEEKCQCKH